MKYVILAAALLAAPVQAQDFDKATLCPAIGDLSEKVMAWRQEGVPLSEAMAVVDMAGVSGDTETLVRLIVLEAYKSDRIYGPVARQRMAQEYRLKMEVVCYGG